VIVDLLVGEELHWSTALIEEIHLFGLPVPVLRREELIRLKRAAGREKDLVDVRELERLA
jgi:predicted nucleotidyltransferase